MNQSDALVEEFRYNGLGHRIGWHYNVDGDGSVEAYIPGTNTDDPWYYFVYDDQWRIVATQRAADGETGSHYFKEQFYYHAADWLTVARLRAILMR